VQRDGSRNDAGFAAHLCERWADGRIKLYVIWKALQLRHKLSGLFTDGEFVPAEVSGERAENVTAFFRTNKNGAALIIAPKWLAAPGIENDHARRDFWSETAISLPPHLSGSWQNAFTSEAFPIASNESHGSLNLSTALGNFPVALLSLN
jgi:(1->4)-alpha-D-glucan 1-alpha-D-glucosylmutase